MAITSYDERLGFGKYQGRKLKFVIKEDPDYVEWCLENVGHFMIDDEAQEMLNNVIEGGWHSF